MLVASQPPPEYFTEPGLTRISSLCRTALENPSIHQVFFCLFSIVQGGNRTFLLSPEATPWNASFCSMAAEDGVPGSEL